MSNKNNNVHTNKLDQALADAQGGNPLEDAIDKGVEIAKDKAKDKVRGKVQDVAVKGGKKALKGARKGIGGALKGGAKQAAQNAVRTAKLAVKGATAFIKSGPVGWAVGAIALIVTITIISSASENSDLDDMAIVDDGMQTEEEIAAILVDDCPPEDYTNRSSDSDFGGASGGIDDPNSVYYQNAKQTFEIWVEGGLSGAAAAGIVGWTMGEGGYGMVGRAEGFYGTDDPVKASVKYGNVPRNSAQPGKPGGGGIYQFTPYTKYAGLGDDAWEDLIIMHEHMFKIMATTGAGWENGPDWIAKSDLTGGNHSFEQFAKHSDPKMTVLMWNAHERMNQGVYHRQNLKPVKEAAAQKIYDMFGGANHPFDPVAFEANFGMSSAGGGGGIGGSGVGVNDHCVAKSLGGSPWGGEGGQPKTDGGTFFWNKVPDDLKQYALDLESIPLRYGQAGDWVNNTSNDHMQCVDLPANLMALIWEKGGRPMDKTKSMGNGGAVVGNYVRHYGGSSSKVPSAGAVFSTTTGSAMCGGVKCGHTGVVSHVFDNGDFLLIEQNWGRYSGTGVAKNSYNYRYVTKGDIGSSGFSFFDPSKVGYKLKKGLKSL